MSHPRKSPYTDISRRGFVPSEPIPSHPSHTDMLNSIPLKTIVSNQRIKDYMSDQAKRRDKRVRSIERGKQSLAFGYLVGLVYPFIVNKVRKSPSSPFNGLTPYQIHVVLSVWIVCLLNEDGLCSSSQILAHKDKPNRRFVNMTIQHLESVGILRAVDDTELHRISGKIRYFNNSKYLVLSSLGNRLVDEFNDIFSKVWLKMVGDTWLSTLEKLP